MPSRRNDNSNWKPCSQGEINYWLQSKNRADQRKLARRNLLKVVGLSSLVIGVGTVSYLLKSNQGPTLPLKNISCPMCIQNLGKYHKRKLSRQMRAEVELHLKKCKTCDRIYKTHYQKLG